MASDEAIGTTIRALLASGCPKPAAWGAAGFAGVTMVDVISAWNLALVDVSDQQLGAAVAIFLDSPAERPWMPTPQQLKALISTADGADLAGEDWARLRRMRLLHGQQLPEDPGTRGSLVSLHEDRFEAQARWAGVAAAGGWPAVCAGNRAPFVAGYEAKVEAAGRLVAADLVADERPVVFGSDAWRAQGGQIRQRLPSSVHEALQTWLADASVAVAWFEVSAIAAEVGPAATIEDPTRARIFRLHRDPARELAMWAGMTAAGGWLEIWPEGTAIPEDQRASDAANRKAFVGAYTASMQRAAKRDGLGRVAALLGTTAGALQIGGESNVVDLAARRRQIGGGS
jgi:hypothetical protein